MTIYFLDTLLYVCYTTFDILSYISRTTIGKRVLTTLGINNIKVMLLAYSSDATKDLGLSSLEEVFTYLDKDSEYYIEHNSAKKFKVYYKKMKQLQ